MVDKISEIITRRLSLHKKPKRRKLSRSCSYEKRNNATLVKRFSRRFSIQKKVVYRCDTSVAIFGDCRVGKSTIVNALADLKKYRKVSYRPTVTETYNRAITLKSKNGKICHHQVKLVDTSGKIRTDYFPTFDVTVKSCEAFILVFSMHNEESLREAELLLEQIDRVKKSTNTPILLIGTKLLYNQGENISDQKNNSKRIKKLSRGIFVEKYIDLDEEDYVDGFVKLLTEIEFRKGIDRSFYGVQVI